MSKERLSYNPCTFPPLVASKFAALCDFMSSDMKTLCFCDWYPQTPSKFSMLASRKLDYSLTNQFDSFPPFLDRLPNLMHLRFDNCKSKSNWSAEERTFFDVLPFQPLFQPLHLRTLAIVGCGLKDAESISFRERGLHCGKICWKGSFWAHLPHLESLDLSDNSLSRLPDTLGLCTSLTSLNIIKNKIDCLPDCILMLKSLKTLLASYNRLWKIPYDISTCCPDLQLFHFMRQGSQGKRTITLPGIEKKFVVAQCKFEKLSRHPSPQSHHRGVLEMWNYYVKTTAMVKPNRFKLVFVGDGAVGKTTTIRSLQKLTSSGAAESSLPSNVLENVATDGVDIKTVRVPMKQKSESNEVITYSCWDFAGQDIYTYSHPFFLTKRSVYMIGFDCSDGDSSRSIERVDYWLQAIRARFPDAHCVLFGTHIDSLDREQLRNLQLSIYARYNLFKDKDGHVHHVAGMNHRFRVSNIHFISNQSGKGLSDLVEELRSIPSAFEKNPARIEVPLSWLRLEERGKAIGSIRLVPTMSWSEWNDLAETEFMIHRSELENATAYMHETGTISWFNEEGLKDFVCLRPSFLTDAIATVITAKVGISSSGILQHESLPQIWKGLPAELYPHMLRLLQKFEMIHPLDEEFVSTLPSVAYRLARKRQRPASRVRSTALPLPLPASSFDPSSPPTPASSSSSNPSSPPISPLSEEADVRADSPSPTPFASSSASSLNDELLSPHRSLDSTQSPSPHLAAQPPTTTPQNPSEADRSPHSERDILQGYSIIPAMLPNQPPPPELLGLIWPASSASAHEYCRIYSFNFIPNGFFTRLLVRVLQSKWAPISFWREGIIVRKNQAKIFLEYQPARRTITLRIRGPHSLSLMGSLIDSISTLIADWSPESPPSICIPMEVKPGMVVQVDFGDLSRVAQTGEVFFAFPEHPDVPPLRIDSVAPDVTLFTQSTATFAVNDVTFGTEIGRGGFARVMKGILFDGRQAACKMLLATSLDDDTNGPTYIDAFTEFRREVWLMSKLKHPNLVSLLGIVPAPHLCMVLEYMEEGNLFDFLHGNPVTGRISAKLSDDDRFELAIGIAEGMKFLHSLSPPIIHRDLKSPNILLTFSSPDGSKRRVPIPKIADFGLSRGLVWEPSINGSVVENPAWLAPEIINRKPHNEKIDVYAFGVILYEIVSGRRFFSNFKFDHEKEAAILQGCRPPLAHDADAVLSYLIKQCWSPLPSDRPSFDQIVTALKDRTFIEVPAPSVLSVGSGWELLDLPLSQVQQQAQETPTTPHQPPKAQPSPLDEQRSQPSPPRTQLPQHSSIKFDSPSRRPRASWRASRTMAPPPLPSSCFTTAATTSVSAPPSTSVLADVDSSPPTSPPGHLNSPGSLQLQRTGARTAWQSGTSSTSSGSWRFSINPE